MSLFSQFALNEQSKRTAKKIIISAGILALLWVGASVIAVAATSQSSYTVEKVMAGYQVRDYASHIVAQIVGGDDYEESLSNSRDMLLSYLRGHNTRQESVAMQRPDGVQPQNARVHLATWAPLTITKKNDRYDVSIELPVETTIVTAPRPNNPRVRILQIPPTTRAVVTVSGALSREEVSRRDLVFRELLARDNRVILSTASVTFIGPTWAVPQLKKTEISYIVRK